MKNRLLECYRSLIELEHGSYPDKICLGCEYYKVCKGVVYESRFGRKTRR